MVKCPICGRTKSKKQELIDHVEAEHSSEIPKNMSTAQFIYSKVHGRSYGLCRVCGKPTTWNEKTGKPNQNCGSPECKEVIKKTAQERMLKTYGKVSLMDDIEHQEAMLAKRRISGVYTWSDKVHKFTYTGTYEKYAIEWLDKVMDLDPEQIQMPGPVLPYKFEGKIKYWITDIYLMDFNLIIEIKAGRDENTHPGFAHNRDLEDAKDAAMQKQKQFNYAKVTHKSMTKLLPIFAKIRENNLNFTSKERPIEPIIAINESTTSIPILHMSNEDIDAMCDNIMDEYTMSIGNVSPIMSTGMYQEGPQDNMFSPRNTVQTPDYFTPGGNIHDMDEDVRVDYETDPYYSKPNDFAEMVRSNIQSYFDPN